MMNSKKILYCLEQLSDEKSKIGMQKFGINTEKAFGISIKKLRELAKEYGENHPIALDLWKSGFHEARILASMMANAQLMNSEEMNVWVECFNSWDLCDQVCGNLFEDSPLAYKKATEWVNSEKEFIKRAGFVMMARLAVSDKKKEDSYFLPFFELIIRDATDERNFVKKAVNWALRQIGKRSFFLREQSILCINELLKTENKTAQWIAKDALKELSNENIIKRIKR